MKENWEDKQVIDLFLDSDFNFVVSNKTKAEIKRAYFLTQIIIRQQC